MPAKADAQIGFTATVPASRDKVVTVAKHALGAVGNKGDVTETSAKLTLMFYPGLIRALSRRSPTVAVDLKPAPNDAVSVRVHMERWTTLQSRVIFIPIGPKRISGKSEYLAWLRAFRQELTALGATVQATGPWQ